MLSQLQHSVLSSDYEYYSQYGPEAYYAHYYAMHPSMHPYYKGYYEELRIPQEQGYGEG